MWARMSTSLCQISSVPGIGIPYSWWLAAFAAASDFARIRSMTASACTRSIRPFIVKGPPGKLPGLRKSGPPLQQQVQDLLHHHHTAMAIDLHNIFGGIQMSACMNDTKTSSKTCPVSSTIRHRSTDGTPRARSPPIGWNIPLAISTARDHSSGQSHSCPPLRA